MSSTLQMEPLTDAELARLAPKISSMTIRSIAVQRLEFTEDQIQTMIHQCWPDMESFTRGILVKWRNRDATNSRMVFHHVVLIDYPVSVIKYF